MKSKIRYFLRNKINTRHPCMRESGKERFRGNLSILLVNLTKHRIVEGSQQNQVNPQIEIEPKKKGKSTSILSCSEISFNLKLLASLSVMYRMGEILDARVLFVKRHLTFLAREINKQRNFVTSMPWTLSFMWSSLVVFPSFLFFQQYPSRLYRTFLRE